jgi:hypothetical protein
LGSEKVNTDDVFAYTYSRPCGINYRLVKLEVNMLALRTTQTFIGLVGVVGYFVICIQTIKIFLSREIKPTICLNIQIV